MADTSDAMSAIASTPGRPALIAGSLAALMSVSGCIVLTAKVSRFREDPLSAEAVRVAHVDGATVRLPDGERLQLAGVSLGSLTAPQRAEFEQKLRAQLASHRVLVQRLDDRRVRLVALTGGYPRPLGFESWLIPIFPQYVDFYPARLDVALSLLDQGAAKAAAEQVRGAGALLPDPAAARSHLGDPGGGDLVLAYRLAGERAREARRGIYRRPIERLVEAARAGDLAAVRRWIRAGADPNRADTQGARPLGVAAGQGHIEVVGELLERGAALTTGAARAAAIRGKLDVLHLLLDRGVPFDPTADDEGVYWLRQAAAGNDVRLALRLLEAGVPANARDRADTWTALHVAAFHDNRQVARVLLHGGARPGLTDGGGVTPLALARRRGHEKMVEMLRRPSGHPDR